MSSPSWPAASYEDWPATCDTLHAHTQVLGKLAAELAPAEPQLQHACMVCGWDATLAASAEGDPPPIV
jgi:hypothetical protein